MTVLDTILVQRPAQNVQQAKSGIYSTQDKKLYKACQDFEAIFVKQMISSMKKTVEKSGMLDGGFAEDVYEDMLYDEYAQKIAANARLGISDMLYRQLKQ